MSKFNIFKKTEYSADTNYEEDFMEEEYEDDYYEEEEDENFKTYEDCLFDQDPEQYELVMELITERETMDSDEREEKIDSLDPEYQNLVYDSDYEFADNAIGDSSWRNGNF